MMTRLGVVLVGVLVAGGGASGSSGVLVIEPDVADGTVTVASGIAVGVRFMGVAVAASTMAPVVGELLPGMRILSEAVAVIEGCDATG